MAQITSLMCYDSSKFMSGGVCSNPQYWQLNWVCVILWNICRSEKAFHFITVGNWMLTSDSPHVTCCKIPAWQSDPRMNCNLNRCSYSAFFMHLNNKYKLHSCQNTLSVLVYRPWFAKQIKSQIYCKQSDRKFFLGSVYPSAICLTVYLHYKDLL